MLKVERNHQGFCNHSKHLEIIGTGGFEGVGKKEQWYNAYFCTKCKKVYLEDCDFSEQIRLFYSKKATKHYLKDLAKSE